jgi:hypothetical protein
MHERALANKLVIYYPQHDSTREYNMFVRYPQHDLGVQDAFLASRRFSPPKFKMLYQQLYYCTVRYQHNSTQ